MFRKRTFMIIHYSVKVKRIVTFRCNIVIMPKNGVAELNEMYNRIEMLCKDRGVNITEMCRKAGIPRGALTDLKMNRTIELSTKTLAKISTYFHVSLDYLLGTEKETAPTPEDEREIGFDDFTYAFFNESKDLPEEKKRMLLDMARFMRADIENEKGK